jgi:3'-5' exoribonuclease
MQHIWIKDIQENDRVEGKYLVKGKTIGKTRQGNPFLTLLLGDKTGTIEGKIWDRVEEITPLFKEGDIVAINGQVNTYRNQIQIQIYELRQDESPVDPAIFQESSQKDTEQMFSQLKKLAGKIKNNHLKALVDSFLGDRHFASKFKKAPAAKYFHHSYIGGLLEHTLAVSQIAVMIGDLYPDLDADLLLSGAILHDIGKVEEFSYDMNIEYTDEGRLLGHITMGVSMLEEKLKFQKDFPPDLAVNLKHLILSHHGEFEFGSPKRPKFPEAFALHLADDLDAKVIGLSRLIKDDKQEGSWTAFNNLFQRYFFKGDTSYQADSKEDAGGKSNRQGYLFT